jgi:hypothetical protein
MRIDVLSVKIHPHQVFSGLLRRISYALLAGNLGATPEIRDTEYLPIPAATWASPVTIPFLQSVHIFQDLLESPDVLWQFHPSGNVQDLFKDTSGNSLVDLNDRAPAVYISSSGMRDIPRVIPILCR